jgi:hypothetical protein
MYLLKSKPDCIIFIPRHVKARYYIKFTNKFNKNESPREGKRSYSSYENAIYAVAGNKVHLN